MASHPIIGISGSISTDEKQQYVLRDYMRAVLHAGGVPVLLSLDMEGSALDGCLARLDGLLLAGGNDIDPALFHASPLPGLGEVNQLRDGFEMRLLEKAMEKRLPVLGICRGIQVMNAALGGTLYQDLPSQRKESCLHTQTCPYHYPWHVVQVEADTLLSRLIGEGQLRVNSMHHQAVWQTAPTLLASAMAEDGVIEAVEHPGLPFFLGVQWHPERMFATDPRAAALFDGLCRAALGVLSSECTVMS